MLLSSDPRSWSSLSSPRPFLSPGGLCSIDSRWDVVMAVSKKWAGTNFMIFPEVGECIAHLSSKSRIYSDLQWFTGRCGILFSPQDLVCPRWAVGGPCYHFWPRAPDCSRCRQIFDNIDGTTWGMKNVAGGLSWRFSGIQPMTSESSEWQWLTWVTNMSD